MIKVFKMISGEELISDCEDSGGGYKLDNPATIVMQQTEKGVGVALMPYMPYASGKVTLHLSAVASEAEADPKMVNEYNRIYGSGIEVVSASALQGLKVTPY
jgi:hypothetical protein